MDERNFIEKKTLQRVICIFIFRQFRTTFRALFLTPLQRCCHIVTRVQTDTCQAELDQTTIISGHKGRYGDCIVLQINRFLFIIVFRRNSDLTTSVVRPWGKTFFHL